MQRLGDQHRDTTGGHGRVEVRRCWAAEVAGKGILDTEGFAGVRTVAKVEAERHIDGKTTTETHYFISSLEADAERLLETTRTHWHIDNKIHWVLDVALREPVLDSKSVDINERESASFSVVRILLTENAAEAMHKDYSSDLTDSQWKQIRKHLNTAYHRRHDLRRDILDAVLYLVKTGCHQAKDNPSQRMLPGEFALWQTVYYYFRKWKKQDLIERLLHLARQKAREEADRNAEPSAVMIDCQSVPATRMGGPSGFDAYKKVKGRKRHVVVDTQGLTWEGGRARGQRTREPARL